MCSPVLPTLSGALKIGSGIFDALGKNDKIDAKIAEAQREQENLQKQAFFTLDQNQRSEDLHNMELSQSIGSVRSSLASQGIVINDADSSAMHLENDMEYFGGLEALNMREQSEFQLEDIQYKSDELTHGISALRKGKNTSMISLLFDTGSSIFDD